MTTCEEWRMSLGALALGGLDADEEREVRQHLVGCPACARESAELADTGALLALIDPDDVTPPRPPGDDLLSRMLRQVGAERRRRRWVSALSVAAAVVVVVAGAVAIGSRSPGQAPVAGPSPSASSSVGVVAATDSASGVSMRIETTPKGWGTALHLELGGVPAGLRCSLVAVGPSEAREVAATWTVPVNGYGDSGAASRLVIDGAVGFQPTEVAAYEIVTTDGRTLVSGSPA